MSSKSVICFDISKNERFQITDNYKMLHRKLKSQYIIEQNDMELKPEILAKLKIFILAGPQDRFTEEEFEALKAYVDNGGSLWVLLGEGGENEFNTNVNFFLEQYGIYINSDNVIRPHYYKNFHPKECSIGGGVVCESMWRHILKQPVDKVDYDFSDEKYKLHFQYPYGATLNVSEPANVLLTTGPVVYPFNRPLAGYYCNEAKGKILAIGSGYMFHDKYLSSYKTNDAILEYILKLLATNDIQFNHLDFNDVELNDNKTFTDIGFIADLPKACLIDSIGSEIPADFKKMFDMSLCSLSNRLLKDVINTYQQLNVKYEPLKIIKPQFEIPLPPLQLATFPPIFSEPAAPPLELYDLDEIFSPPRSQLANMTGQCLQALQASKNPRKPPNLKELENYIKECARITAIINEQHDMSPREILNVVAHQIVSYRPYE
ncbi:intraflagellar transport protein 52 homolog [Musca vetustissima]|uniref:intraflagellar transport protein 52 homolog n=1 Tax=Musca vetustissima TaxID=27455 RepID=UPI002AB7BDB4|nr:intraflagellar transport protein 52 homolog [Musca vetustissima]XP_061397843.1 intraflagellar transport protein 52 homolog [Musca vetustissima]